MEIRSSAWPYCVCVSFKMELVVKVRRRYVWNFSLNLSNLIGSLGSWFTVELVRYLTRVRLKSLTRTLRGQIESKLKLYQRLWSIYSSLQFEVYNYTNGHIQIDLKWSRTASLKEEDIINYTNLQRTNLTSKSVNQVHTCSL